MRTSLREIQGLAEIAVSYRGIICDLWGVVHNGRRAFEPALNALAEARSAERSVIFVSNAPRPEISVVHQLDRLGIERALYLGISTSGDLTRSAIADGRYGRAFWHLGPDRDFQLYDGLDLARVPLGAAEFILCTGPFDDSKERPADYAERFREAIGRRLVLVCANPDLAVLRGDMMIPCAGALAALYAQMGGAVAYFGKPDPAIFDAAIARLGFAKEDVLVIGDGLKTDIKGAKAADLDALLIAGGINGDVLIGDDGPLDLQRISALAAREGGRPQYVLKALTW